MKHPGVAKLKPDEDNFVIIPSKLSRDLHEDVKRLIDAIGIMSSSSQGLNHIITTFSSFSQSDSTIYMLLNDDRKEVLGFIKVGPKHLFLWDNVGIQHEYMRIMCLLDFFVHPSCQRSGYGKKLIDKFLTIEKKQMKEVPIDKPSSLCLSFMKKHFGLQNCLHQNNNYIVYDQFFEGVNNGSNSALESRYSNLPLLNKSPRFAQMRNQHRGPSNLVYGQTRTLGRRGGLNPITWLPY